MIATDWTHPDPVFCDFETQSAVDLKKVGGRAYAHDRTTRPAMCAFSHCGRKTVWMMCPHTLPERIAGFEVHRETNPPQWVLEAIANGTPLCAHNALEFDAHVWESASLPPARWRDTLPLCRAAALPGSLDAACKLLFGVEKNELGRRTWLSMCQARVNRSGDAEYPLGTAEAWVLSAQYCCQDVEMLSRLHAEVLKFAEPSALQVHQAINDRGIPVDVAFAARLVLLQDELAVKCGGAVSEITEGDLELRSLRSVSRIKSWFERKGVVLPTRDGKPSLDKRDMQQFLRDPEEFCGGNDDLSELAAAVLQLRAEVTRATGGKAMRLVSAALEDGRARGQHVYYGALTGRFSGREVQPHNFPRGVDGVDPRLAKHDLTLEEVEAEAARLGCTAGDVIGSLLRPCVAGRISPCDYAAIEARGVCWVAGEEKQLEMFNDPRADVYVDLARKVYGTNVVTKAQRWNAKQAELGCGYGMSGRKFSAMLQQWGADSCGVTADHVVRTYRREHPAVVRGWHDLNRAALAAAGGADAAACRARFYQLGSCLVMELPSGRKLVYRDARIEMVVPGFCAAFGLPPIPKPAVTYRHPHGYRKALYGGIIMENLVQGTTRDLLVDELVRAEASGFEPCMHVHDEDICESCSAEEHAVHMSRAPGWAERFPVLCEAFRADRYYKRSPDGKEVRALNGSVVHG